MTTPGPSFVWDTAALVSGGFVWDVYRGLGITADLIPTGFGDPALLANDIDGADPAGTEYRMEILSGPSGGGTFTLYNDSSFTYSGPDGIHSGTQRVFKNGAYEDTTFSFVIGAARHILSGSTSTQVNLSPAGLLPDIGTRDVVLTLQKHDGTVQASLSGINWRWSDVRGTVIDSGTGETTNASGVLALSVHSALSIGGIGWLELDNSDGTTINATYCAFAGPVAVE